jgi:hypothetical protein
VTHAYLSGGSAPTRGAQGHPLDALGVLPIDLRPAPEPPSDTPPERLSVGGLQGPSDSLFGPPQPQQAYLGTAASSTTNTEACRAAPIVLSLRWGIAIAGLQRSPIDGFLLRRPSTGRPPAAV